MKLVFTFLAAASLFIGSFAAARTTTCFYEVKGMTCSSCVATLKVGVKKLDGIKKVDASEEKSSAAVSFDPQKTSSEKIKDAIAKIGYEAKLQQCKEAS